LKFESSREKDVWPGVSVCSHLKLIRLLGRRIKEGEGRIAKVQEERKKIAQQQREGKEIIVLPLDQKVKRVIPTSKACIGIQEGRMLNPRIVVKGGKAFRLCSK